MVLTGEFGFVSIFAGQVLRRDDQVFFLGGEHRRFGIAKSSKDSAENTNEQDANQRTEEGDLPAEAETGEWESGRQGVTPFHSIYHSNSMGGFVVASALHAKVVVPGGKEQPDAQKLAAVEHGLNPYFSGSFVGNSGVAAMR